MLRLGLSKLLDAIGLILCSLIPLYWNRAFDY